MSDLRKAIERLKKPMRHHDHKVTYHSAINDVLALPELKSAIDKVEGVEILERRTNDLDESYLIVLDKIIELKNKASKYDKLFSNLQAVETVKALVSGTFTPAKAEQDIYRPLTEAEKEEIGKRAMSLHIKLYEIDEYITLKSGVKVEVKK